MGDYHADVATTLLFLDFAPVKLTKWMHWLVSLPGQGILRRRYLPPIGTGCPLTIGNRTITWPGRPSGAWLSGEDGSTRAPGPQASNLPR